MKRLPYFVLVCFALTFFSGCVSLFPTPGEKLMIHAGSIGSKVGSRYGLAISGTGASWPGEFKFVAIDYASYREMEIDEARELVVTIVEDLLVEFNTKAAADCQLEFHLKNLCVMIFFENPLTGKQIMSETKLALAAFSGDRIAYKVFPSEEKDFETILREPYSEAYRKVMGCEREDLNENVEISSSLPLGGYPF